MFDGVCDVPSACRVMEKTTAIRVNDVTMIKMLGATDKTVSSKTNWTILAVEDPPVSPKSILTLCAAAGTAAKHKSSAADRIF